MKILVCIDGSEQSQKAVEKATAVAQSPEVEEVAIMHVYEQKLDFSYLPTYEVGPITKDEVTIEDVKRLSKMQEELENERNIILTDALKAFEAKNIKARKLLLEGPPAQTILRVAEGEGFDMIVLGSRGLGGIKKVFLGSVSNAVTQGVENCSVLIVK